MDRERFLSEFGRRAGIDPSDAERAVDATLETLGERVPKTERQHLAAQIPNELKEPLLRRHQHAAFGLEEFYTRVARRADVRYPHAVVRARAAAAVLREATSAGEIEDVLGQISSEFREVFGEEPDSPASPTALTTEEQRHVEEGRP